jgi:hypothetical protein
VGGSRERPKPEGLTLLQHLPDGTWKGVDISSEVPHPTLAVGPLNNPKNNMIHSEAGLLFSTVSIDGEAVTLQAWTTDLSIHWQKNDHFLLAVSDQKIISGWDNSTTFDRLNAAYKTTGEMVLYVLDESGIEIGSLELPWPVFSMPFRPSCNGYYCYLSSPDKTLVAVQIP